MPPKYDLSIDDILSILSATPARISEATAGITEARLAASPAPAEWSANDVLAHLRACADVWGIAIGRMLAEDHPRFAAINPRSWIKRTDYPSQRFARSQEAFAAQRQELLAVLEALAPPAWARSATVSVAGRPYERSLKFYAQWLATHERPHLQQIARLAQPAR